MIQLKNHAGCFRFVFLLSRVIIRYTDYTVIATFIGYNKTCKQWLLMGCSMRCGRFKRKCTVSPVDCNVSV